MSISTSAFNDLLAIQERVRLLMDRALNLMPDIPEVVSYPLENVLNTLEELILEAEAGGLTEGHITALTMDVDDLAFNLDKIA